MDITFDCKKCDQRIVIDEAGAGMSVQCPTCGEGLVVPLKPDPDFQPPSEAAKRSARKRGIDVTPDMNHADLCYKLDAITKGEEYASRKREYYRRKKVGENLWAEQSEWHELADQFILAIYRKPLTLDDVAVNILYVEAAVSDVEQECVFLHAILPRLVDQQPPYIHWEQNSDDRSKAIKIPVADILYHKNVTGKFKVRGKLAEGLDLIDNDLYDLKWYQKQIDEGMERARKRSGLS